MSEYNWIKVNRNLQDHWLFDVEKICGVGAWLDLLMMSNFKDGHTCIANALISVERGQKVTSILKLSKRWKRDRKWVSRFLNNLEKDGMIIQKRHNRYTVITICNYNRFQSQFAYYITTEGTQVEHEENSSEDNSSNIKGTSKGHVKDTTGTQYKNVRRKECKELKKKEKDLFSEKLENLNFDVWMKELNITEEDKSLWYRNRKSKRLPVSQSIVNRHGKKLNSLFSAGYDVRKCLELFLDNAWQSPEPSYFENKPHLKRIKTINEIYAEQGMIIE